MRPGGGSAAPDGAAAELRAGPTHHVGVAVVNERFLKPVVEDDDDRVRQVARVTDLGQETPDIARKQPVRQTWRK